MHTKHQDNEYWITMVCIDSYEDGVLRGQFFNPYLEAPQQFHSLSEFLIMMECTLDSMQLPQAYAASRSFGPSPVYLPGKPARDFHHGKKATFSLSVRFRQHNSWQGTITWLEGGKKQSFRSVLELIVLMDSAMRSSEHPGTKKVAMA